MLVFLIKPNRNKSFFYKNIIQYEPIELEILAQNINDICEVEILDMRLQDNLTNKLNNCNPAIIGITGYIDDTYRILEIAKLAKAKRPESLIVIGGPQATMVSEAFFNDNVDIIVVGEGEDVFRKIVQKHQKKDNDFSSIPGLYIRTQNNKFSLTSPACNIDLSKMPVIKRDLTAHLRKKYYYRNIKPVASIITTKGCPFRCKFCGHWHIRPSVACRDPEIVIEELSLIQEKNVIFTEDNTFHNVKNAQKLCTLIRESGIRKVIHGYCRTDQIIKHPQLLADWHAVGLNSIFVGFEAVTDSNLNFIGKKNTTANNVQAIKLCREMGINICGNFIVMPFFKEDEFKQLIDFSIDNELYDVTFSILTPLPGTDLYEDYKEQLLTHNYTFYDLSHCIVPCELPRYQFYKNFMSIYRNLFSFKRYFDFLHKKRIKQTIASFPFMNTMVFGLGGIIAPRFLYNAERRY